MAGGNLTHLGDILPYYRHSGSKIALHCHDNAAPPAQDRARLLNDLSCRGSKNAPNRVERRGGPRPVYCREGRKRKDRPAPVAPVWHCPAQVRAARGGDLTRNSEPFGGGS